MNPRALWLCGSDYGQRYVQPQPELPAPSPIVLRHDREIADLQQRVDRLMARLDELMALARSGALPPMPLNVRGLAQAQQALDDLRAGRVHGRTVLSARDTGQPGG